MQDLFQKISGEQGQDLSEGQALYFKQIQSRLVVTPANTILKRCQNIWGRPFLHKLIADFYAVYTPETYRVDQTLERLPEFVSCHSHYSQIFALLDAILLCLKSWHCIYGSDPPTRPMTEPLTVDLLHSKLAMQIFWTFPHDKLDLFQFWLASASHQEIANAESWRLWANAPQRGLIFIKLSAQDGVTLPLDARDRILLEYLCQGHSLGFALGLLKTHEMAAISPTLAETLAQWSRHGLLLPKPDSNYKEIKEIKNLKTL